MQEPAKKRRRNSLKFAAFLAAFAAFQAYAAYHAQSQHTVVRYKTGWYTPEAGYVAALCILLIAAYLAIAALRRGDSETR